MDAKSIISLYGQPKPAPVSGSRFRLACVRHDHDRTLSHSTSCGSTWSRTVDKGKFRSVLFHYDANQCGGSLAVNMLSREGAQFFTYDQSSSHVVLIILSLLNRQRLNGIEELD